MIQMNSDMLSQEEIDALLNGSDSEDTNEDNNLEDLSDVERDALGEIGNISMGTAATTLFTLLGQKVLITTPNVEVITLEDLSDEYPRPFVAVDVKYKEGLQGANLLILKIEDVKVITDLMMGGDGTNTDRDLNEMDLSAISEAMNQMVGSASTSLSEIFSKKIDIDPPRAFEMQFNNADVDTNIFDINGKVVKVSFKMVVGDLIDSQIMQILPFDFAKKLTTELLKSDEHKDESNIDTSVNNLAYEDYQDDDNNEEIYMPPKADYSDSYEESKTNGNKVSKEEQVNVQKVKFNSFDKRENIIYNESIDMIQDIPIEITVELGRTTRKINEILEYGPGTIIELDKLVGEPLEIFANGKFIAKGEVVVIDDNFGIRVTDILKPSKRISK